MLLRTREPYTFVDLFAGAGGFTEGFLLAGEESNFELLGATDVSPMAQLTHERRFRDQLGQRYSFVTQDIRNPSFTKYFLDSVRSIHGDKPIDVVCGGPPCQGFSVFGKRTEDDPRNDLFRPYLAFIERVQPKYFVMENVPGLVQMYKGRAVEQIIAGIENLQTVKYQVSGPLRVNAAEYGVPQNRERVLFIGSRLDMPPIRDVTRPGLFEEVSVADAISDLSFLRAWETADKYAPTYPVESQYQIESRRGRLFKKLGMVSRHPNVLRNHEAARHRPEIIARFAMIEEGRGLESVPRELWDKHLKSSKKWCVRLDRSRPSYTMVTLPDDFVHYVQHRILTVRETARLQSFDDTFVFAGPRATGGGGAGNRKRFVELPQYSQVGNAVPPLMAKAIAETILGRLESQQHEISDRIHRRL